MKFQQTVLFTQDQAIIPASTPFSADNPQANQMQNYWYQLTLQVNIKRLVRLSQIMLRDLKRKRVLKKQEFKLND